MAPRQLLHMPAGVHGGYAVPSVGQPRPRYGNDDAINLGKWADWSNHYVTTPYFANSGFVQRRAPRQRMVAARSGPQPAVEPARGFKEHILGKLVAGVKGQQFDVL